MEKSENYGFNLPNSENDGIADINLISENFSKIDSELSEMIKGKGVDQSYSPTSKNPQSGTAVAGAISNLVSLEDNTEWIFDGGDASGSVEIDLVIDAEMSDTSNNPVSNKVIKKYVDNMVDLIYPVGSIYMSANDTSPSILFGGEWERIKDRFLLSAGDTYSAGSTGGSATHTLTVDEMPSHEGHLYANETAFVPNGPDSYFLDYNAATSNGILEKYNDRPYIIAAGNEAIIKGFSRGGTEPHNNMPPYLAVYMWKRIS